MFNKQAQNKDFHLHARPEYRQAKHKLPELIQQAEKTAV